MKIHHNFHSIKQVAKPVLFVGLVILAVAVFMLSPLSISDFTPGKIQHFVLSFGLIAPLIFVLLYTARSFFVILPAGVLSLASGLIFGKWWGTVLILIGATAGAALSFAFARYTGSGIGNRLSRKFPRINTKLSKNGFQTMVILRLIPIIHFDLLNYGAGLSGMNFRDYLLGTFLGMIPLSFLNAWLGESINTPFSLEFWLAVSLSILAMTLSFLIKPLKIYISK